MIPVQTDIDTLIRVLNSKIDTEHQLRMLKAQKPLDIIVGVVIGTGIGLLISAVIVATQDLKKSK